jgi:alpha-1,3-glucanase-like protein/carbohydrate binding protein with CBM35 domain
MFGPASRSALLLSLACVAVNCGKGAPAGSSGASGADGAIATNTDGGAVETSVTGSAGGAGTGSTGSAGSAGTPSGTGAPDAAAGASGVDAAPPAAVIYEAEDAFNGGSATLATTVTGYSGTGYVDALGATGAKIIFAVNAAADATASVTVRYRNAAASKKVAAYINGLPASAVVFAPTTDAGFSSHVDSFALRVGLNTIAYVDEDASTNAVSLDRLELAGGAPPAIQGALVPFTEYEAETGRTTGTAVGPDRTYGTVAAEASGRKAVTLASAGQYVEWTTTRAANALVVRYSMPDAPTGGGTTGTLSLYVDGTKRQSLALSSKYAWVYGAYPYTNDPTQGMPHHYFDETRFLVGDVAAGAVVRLQRDGTDGPVTVDLVDLEVAPAAYARPAGSLSLADFGATPDDGNDDAAALRTAVAAAKSQGKPLWIPAGTFDLGSRVDVDQVTIVGAGPWRSVFQGANGKGGFNGVGDAVKLLDFAMFGDVSYRDDANFDAGLDGATGKGSTVQNVWFEHTKVGIWQVAPTSGLYIVGCRIHDTFADGINLNSGAARSAAEHVHVRNTGDDAFAIWANAAGTDGNRFKLDSARVPTLANGFAIYGGSDNSIEDSDAADTVWSPAGVAISTRFSPTPFGGTTSVLRTTLTRTGGYIPDWNGNLGGLWIYADSSLITAPIVVRDVVIADSTYQGLLVSPDKPISGLLFERVTIAGAGSYGIEVDATGGGTFNAVTVSGATTTAAMIAPGFTATKGSGDTGW